LAAEDRPVWDLKILGLLPGGHHAATRYAEQGIIKQLMDF
jgi:hypothetical protein